MKDFFAKYDGLILPVGDGPAPLINDANDKLDLKMSALNSHLDIGNFGGFPSITIPNGFVNGLPVGINITGNCYKDANVLSIAYSLESKMSFKGQIAKERM